jgi:pimeloyl-ACP methyl ester carboxylesterase
VRWALVLAAVFPTILGMSALLFGVAGNQELACTYLRGFRLLIAAELVLVLILACVGLAYEQRARAHDAAQFRPPGSLVDLGGYKLHLYCTGSGGPTVILEHGHQATYLDWNLVQPKLSQFARVCSFDRAGYGWSDPSPQPRLPSRMAEELRRLLEAAGEKPPYILVGHSFGGLDAIMFAHKFPSQVAGVVLVDSSHPDGLKQSSWQSRFWLRLMQFTMPFGLPRSRGWCGGGPQETLRIKRALNCQPENIRTIFREDAAFPVTVQEIRQIADLGSLPLVVIARDPATGPDAVSAASHTQQQRAWAMLSRDSKFVIAQGSGHDIPLARPEVIVESVRDLIKLREQADSRGTP